MKVAGDVHDSQRIPNDFRDSVTVPLVPPSGQTLNFKLRKDKLLLHYLFSATLSYCGCYATLQPVGISRFLMTHSSSPPRFLILLHVR